MEKSPKQSMRKGASWQQRKHRELSLIPKEERDSFTSPKQEEDAIKRNIQGGKKKELSEIKNMRQKVENQVEEFNQNIEHKGKKIEHVKEKMRKFEAQSQDIWILGIPGRENGRNRGKKSSLK